jgi:hypothetical protein
LSFGFHSSSFCLLMRGPMVCRAHPTAVAPSGGASRCRYRGPGGWTRAGRRCLGLAGLRVGHMPGGSARTLAMVRPLNRACMKMGCHSEPLFS